MQLLTTILVVLLQFVIAFAIATGIKCMVNKGLFAVVHTFETVMLLLGIIVLKMYQSNWLSDIIFMATFWRTSFRLVGSCSDLIKDYKSKNGKE